MDLKQTSSLVENVQFFQSILPMFTNKKITIPNKNLKVNLPKQSFPIKFKELQEKEEVFYNLVIKQLKKEEFVVKISSKSDISSLIKMIRIRIENDDFKLLFKGKSLKSEQFFGDYLITDKSVINLILNKNTNIKEGIIKEIELNEKL